MTAQPVAPGPDTGSYEVIHLGGQVGRYRVLYEISEDAVAIRHIARGVVAGS